MASDRVPAADDLTPVLIYVIIKVSFAIFLFLGRKTANFNNNGAKSLIQYLPQKTLLISNLIF
jgi:hypothetical protein